MNGHPLGNEKLLVPMGVYDGIYHINKFGENTAVATDTTEDIWDGSSLYTFPATAVMTHVSQTTNQAALTGETVEVQGLDANWNLVTQTVTLNASDTTTAVALATPLIRAFRMRLLSNTIQDQPIRLHNADETVDYAVMSSNHNQTAMAIYTIPDGYTGYLTNYYVHHHPATNQNPTSLDIHMWGRDNKNGYERQLKHTVGIPSDGSFQHHFDPYVIFTERSDIYLSATTVGKAAHVSGGFDLYVVPNDKKDQKGWY
jgi:hypothetical protein